MATAPPSLLDPCYEPEPRLLHCGALVEGKWITYGGFGANGDMTDPTSVDVFDPDREEWTQMTTSGTPPSGIGGAACVAVGPLLYHIDGAVEGVDYNTVHCLDTTTMEWRELQPANPQAAPMKKAGLAGISYGSIIVTVGGHGELPTNRHPEVEYIPHPKSEGRGWTNEVVCYDTEQNMWFRPTITGSPPPACAFSSLTRVDHHRAVLFGGQGKDSKPISPDVYILDMNHWTWTVIPASQTPNHPVARGIHSSISVYDPDADPTHPALLIMWGDGDDEILRDSWIFHLNQQQWKKVILPETLKGRMYHTSVVIHSSPKIRIICFGGIDDWPEDDDDDPVLIAQTTMVELSCSGGHPAEWIVTDVSQLGEGDRLPTHIKLTMEEEMRHLTICERIMREKGKANLNFALCLLNGPPRVGKSTFLSRITGRPLPQSANDEYLISETPSTGVAERVLQVVIKKSSFTIALAPQSPKPPQAPRSEINWQIVTISQEAVMMLKAILSSQPSLAIEQLESQMPPTNTSDLVPTSSEGLSPEATSNTAAETNRQPIAVEPKMAVVSQMGLFKFGKRKKSPPCIPGYQVPLEIFQKALRSKEWASAEEFLKHALNLYFTDVGGQPEFQEVLPAIIAGPSIFFIVFKLPDRLDQKYEVKYVESIISKESITYESSFTVLESILQSLASIASMCSYVHVSRGSTRLVPIKPKVVLIGTHKDEADAKHIRSVQRELKEHLLRTDHVKEGIIEFASDDEPALTINNLSDDETDAANIRCIVEEIARDPAFNISVPAPWLALLLSLRLIESSVISYDDCLSMAKDCGIDGDEELKEALRFLHTKLGVIRYFGEVPELSNIVICDPQVIFDKITALISRTFTFEEIRDVYASKEFREKGIFPARIIDEISSHSNEPLSRKQLVILLKHLRIIAPIYKDEEQQDQPQESKTPSHYIVPCVLAHAPAQIEIESTSKGKKTSKIIRKITKILKRRPHPSPTGSAPAIPSVCILFKCGYCPKGMFGALIADLMSPAGTRLCWRLLDDAIYRDQASFHVGPEHHTVRITFFISFLEVCISADTENARSAQQSNAKAVCNKIRRELEQSLVSVSRTLNYGPGAGIYFGFHSICSCSVPAKCDEENPVVMKCDRCGLATDLQDTHKFWFGEEVHVSIDDLEKMLSAAWEARAKWYNIGLQLKIGAGMLDTIKGDSESIDDRFRSMLSTWLKRDEPRPTLSLLASALHSPTVGYQYLAQKILAQY